jgi:hypothetical protein
MVFIEGFKMINETGVNYEYENKSIKTSTE